MHTSYPDDEPVRSARARYFADHAFGDDGGYGDPFVNVKFFGLPMAFPNVEGRVRAVKVHDLHHIATGYATDPIGEFEISAFEVGGGCRDFYVAWLLNLSGTAGGVLLAPRRTFRAFVRGRRGRTLYGDDLERHLGDTVGALRARMGLTDPADASPARLADVAAFALTAVSGLLVGGAMMPGLLLLAPVGVVMNARRAA